MLSRFRNVYYVSPAFDFFLSGVSKSIIPTRNSAPHKITSNPTPSEKARRILVAACAACPFLTPGSTYPETTPSPYCCVQPSSILSYTYRDFRKSRILNKRSENKLQQLNIHSWSHLHANNLVFIWLSYFFPRIFTKSAAFSTAAP